MKYPYLFTCNITKYKIEYILDDTNNTNVAILNTIICDYKNLKAFFALLRTSVDKLSEKKITIIRQAVGFFEWNNYLKNKTTYKIINIDQKAQIYDIECSLDEFLQNYGIGIGILE